VRGKPLRFVMGHGGRKYPATYVVDAATGCWEWQGRKNDNGYGMLTVDGVETYAHRHFFALEHGPIPEGMKACHTCDNPPCVNPAHLFLGTTRDNAVDASAKGRTRNGRRDKTHCPHGHPYAGENLIVTSKGHRVCRTCQKATKAKYRAHGHPDLRHVCARCGETACREGCTCGGGPDD
jgi:hypothetical protein